ncbi:MAG: hypothetical protein CMF23_18160 [Ignavibacteriae bacterium]|nr:hypothetical protein [Ignavibacteriota bacterium]
MENDKIKFSELYENFTGSGNINGKYWIVGLESGSAEDFENNNSELVNIFLTKDFIQIMNFINDFNQEYSGKSNFLDKEKKLLSALKYDKHHIMIYLDEKEYFYYPKHGDIFRTNIFPLPLKNDDPQTFINALPYYQQFLSFDENFTEKYEIFLRYKNKRISKIKSLMKEKPKFIFILYKEWGESFINDFFNEIFEDIYEKKETVNRIDIFKGNLKTSPVIAVIPQTKISDEEINLFVESQIL